MRLGASIVVLVALGGCSGERSFEADPEGEWLRGDLHVHATGASNDTGGDSFPEDIAATAKERGLYFVVLTDHSNSTGSDPSTTEEDPALFNMGPEFPYWDRAMELSEPGEFVMIDGNEISPVAAGERPSEPTGHIGCVPPAPLSELDRSGAFVDRPRGEVTGGEVLTQALERGCFAVLNHPWGAPWTSYDWSRFGYHGMEVWNGTLGLDDSDEKGWQAWRCDLLQGRDVVPIGASDNHKTHIEAPGSLFDPALGFPSTWVYARERSWAAITEALRDGRVFIGDGDSRLALDGYDADRDRHEGAGTRWLRMRGTLDDSATRATLRLRRATACDDTRMEDGSVPEITDEVLHEEPIEPGASFDVPLEIEGAPGVYTAELRTPSAHWDALSRAVVIE